MTRSNQIPYDKVHGLKPVLICSKFAAPMTRPRLWWLNKEVDWQSHGATLSEKEGNLEVFPPPIRPPFTSFLQDEWEPADQHHNDSDFAFRCLTRSVPRSGPMKDPRGIETCDAQTLARWRADHWAQAPYQYKATNMVISKTQKLRRLLAVEEERLMGFPPHYTAPLLQLDLKDYEFEHRRRSLLGNSWCVFVVVFILQCMGVSSTHRDVPNTSSPSPSSFLPKDCSVTVPVDLLREFEAAATAVQDRFPVPFAEVPFSAQLPFPLPEFLGPDNAELWAAQSYSTISGIQSRNHGFAVSKQRLVPLGLPPDLHAVMASALVSPLDKAPPLPDDLKFACDQVLRDDYPAWLRNQRRRFSAIVDRVRLLSGPLDSFRTASALATCPNVDPYLVLALTHLMQWPDRSLALLPIMGASVVGYIPSVGIYRHSDKTATVSMAEWLESADEWNFSILSRPPPTAEQSQAVWDASLAEQAEGTLSRWYSYHELNARHGKGKWRAMVRFAVQQGQKWRCIDNGRTGCHNDTVTCADRIHTTSVDVAMAMASYMFSQDSAVPKRQHVRGTRDMRKAYRQIPVADSQRGFQIIAVWDPESKQYCFAHLHGLAFGLYASVAHFNRVPSFILAVARRFFGLPCIAYFDDVRLAAVEPHGQLVWDTFGWLVDTLGYVFDPSKDVPMHPRGSFLGFVEDLSQVHSHACASLEPKQEFVQGLQAVMTEALETGSMAHGCARSLRGRLLHLSNGMTGRVGRGQTFSFEHLLQSESTDVPVSLRTSLLFFMQLIELRPWRVFSMSQHAASKFVLYTDAAASGKGLQQLVTLSFVALSDSFQRAGKASMTAEMLGSFEDRATYIAHGEAMACLFSLWHMAKWFRQVSVIHFIDNLGVLSAMCRGSSTVCDISHIVASALSMEAALQMKSWKEHVDSKANLADCGTKDVTDYVSALGISWENLCLPPWPRDLRSASSDDWLRWYTTLPTDDAP